MVLNNEFPRNRLLRALSSCDFALLHARLDPVEIGNRTVFEKPHQPIEHVYFIENGMASVVANGSRDRRIEIGVIGREGMSGTMVILGNHQSPHETFVQMAGEALRLSSDHLREAMATSTTLQPLLLRYAQAFMIQTSHTALANGRAKLHERLARWLLMAHDRTDGDDLPLVHEFLALMLGVRREAVTIALQELEGEGLICATRGNISIIDRGGLEEAADGSYGVPEAEFDRLIGGQSPRPPIQP